MTRVLVTAGPTREHLDDVRYLTNAATGRMGIEVARAAADAGHEVVLVLGPTHLAPPSHPAIRVVPVVSAADMLAACVAEWPSCGALVATAAVADHRPAVRRAGKPEKGAAEATLRLVRNPDVLATLTADKRGRPCVGFALQASGQESRAREKMERKRCDLMVVDSPAALGAERSDFLLLPARGPARALPGAAKSAVAAAIVAFLFPPARG